MRLIKTKRRIARAKETKREPTLKESLEMAKQKYKGNVVFIRTGSASGYYDYGDGGTNETEGVS